MAEGRARLSRFETIYARKRFRLGGVRAAVMSIPADSYYRLWINGEWVGDGPCRSWPGRFQYDELEVGDI